jgi:predicted PurR-regulated permease PerM
LSIWRQIGFWAAALLVVVVFLWLFSGILLPFILGAALAYLLDPVADRLQRIGMSRLFATLTIVLLAVVAIAVAVLIIVPILVSQLEAFLARLPSYVARLQALGTWFLQTEVGLYFGSRESGANLNEMVSKGAAWFASMLGSLWAGGQALIGLVSLLVVTPVVAFYLLLDWDRMLAWLDSLIPRHNVETVRRLAREIDIALAAFVRGQGAVCLILGLLYAVSLSLVGLNFGFLIGAMAGLISFIPYVGTILGFVTSVGVALVQFWPNWIPIVIVAAIFVFGQMVEGYFLQPRLIGSSVGVHPVWLMFALFAFGSLFGFVGLLLAVPATAAIGVLVRFAVERYRQSPIYQENGGEPPSLTM